MYALRSAIASPALPAGLLLIGMAVAATQFDMPARFFPQAGFAGPQTVTLAPGSFTYRAEGHFLAEGNPVDAPMVETRFDEPLTVMKYQVSRAEYEACIADGACLPAQENKKLQGNVPVTGVNFDDANAYAAWLSAKTGQQWALPTDRQWAYAAQVDYADDALGTQDDATNPAQRWLADYEKEAARERSAGPDPLPLGHFGENENGLADIGGNVWEWTQTCHRRVHMDGEGNILSEVPACGIKVLEGQHRAPMSSFIRDAKSGGCSVGIPPDNLGFRLVRVPAWHERLLALVGLGK